MTRSTAASGIITTEAWVRAVQDLLLDQPEDVLEAVLVALNTGGIQAVYAELARRGKIVLECGRCDRAYEPVTQDDGTMMLRCLGCGASALIPGYTTANPGTPEAPRG